MANNIYFFQHFHNGDLFVTKEYIRQIVDELNVNFNFGYFHNNNPKTLLDLNIPFLGNTNHFGDNGLDFPRFIEPSDNTLYINTHVAVYRWPRPNSLFTEPGINHNSMMPMWDHIFKKINQKFNTNLKLKDKEFYIGKIDFSRFNTSHAAEFLENRKTKKILISNGRPMSKQSFKENMSDVVIMLSTEFPEWDFICTEKFKSSKENIFFTDDIIKEMPQEIETPAWCRPICDLNEISFISNRCKIIVGKNSGPFIYCMTQDNLLNFDKTIISLNKDEHDSLLWDLKFNSRYSWTNNFDSENIKNFIVSAIQSYKDKE